jgi:hypothetical protein
MKSPFVALTTVLAALGSASLVSSAPNGNGNGNGHGNGNGNNGNSAGKATLTGPNGEPYVTGKWFDRFFMIIGENMDFWDVESQSTFANLWKDAPNGRLLGNYYAITHPSQVR